MTRKFTSVAAIVAVLTLSMSSLFAAPAFAASSGPNNAGTGASVNSSSSSDNAWANPGNITSSGSPYATANNVNQDGGLTRYLEGTNYGFSIPSTATINGIAVSIRRESSGISSPYLRDNVVRLVKAGTIVGTNKANTGTDWTLNSFGTASYGGSSDLWGTTWTPAQINASNFGVALQAINPNSSHTRDATVDYMQVTVYYTDAPADTTAPSGGSISYTNGYTNSTSASVTFSTGTDSGSGLNLSSGKIQRSVGTLSVGSCSGYGSFTDLVTTTTSPYTDSTISSGHCYRYRYVISDNSSNTATYTSGNELKVDTGAPTIIVPSSPVTAEATSASGAVVTFSYGISDLLSGVLGLPICSPASGSTFPITTTAVNCSGSDNAGNTGSASFNVTVQDTTAPSITISGSNPLNLNVGDTFTEPSASASDLVDGTVAATVFSDNVDTAHHGTYSVVYHATDAHGNTGSKTLTVNLSDITAPVVTVPSTITAEATGSTGATVNFTVTANDNDDGALTPSCDHASGDTFPLGTTSVHCSATDSSSNVGTNSFNILVVDTTAPTVTPAGDVSVHALGASGAVVTFADPAVSDAVDGTDAVSCSPVSGSLFALGTTTVSCSATDAHGNTGSGTFDVGVYNGAPVLDLISDVTIPLSGHVHFTANATDPEGDTVTYGLGALPSSPVLSIDPTIDPSTGEFFWNSNGSGPRTVSFTVTASDGIDTSSTPFTVVVGDTADPSANTGGGGTGGGNGPFAGISGGPIPSAPGGLVLGASTSTVPENTNDNDGNASTTSGVVLGASTFSECTADHHLITQNLGMNHTNPANLVNLLEKFLNTNLGLNLATNGLFTADVKGAVETFQAAHPADVLTPWGISDPTGFVGITTRRMIDIIACGADYPVPALPKF